MSQVNICDGISSLVKLRVKVSNFAEKEAGSFAVLTKK